MTVQQLIDALAQLDPDAHVYVYEEGPGIAYQVRALNIVGYRHRTPEGEYPSVEPVPCLHM